MTKTKGGGVAYYKAVLRDQDAYIWYLEERHRVFRKAIKRSLILDTLVLVALLIYLISEL